jgi:hypothetical protein
MRWVREIGNMQKILVGKCEGKSASLKMEVAGFSETLVCFC